MDKPLYSCKPIGSIEVLANTLCVHPRKLISIANKVEVSYTSYTLQPHKTTGKVRTVCDPKYELKKIQKLINSRIFANVKFPSYIQGGIKATQDSKRDYIENATLHGRSQTLINLDVKNFYPNIKTEAVKQIFKYFFNFSDDVVEILTKLTTFQGKLPQGGCTSSYLANLVFFNNEYRLVSSLRGKQIRYTRLLDDVTISSQNTLDKRTCENIIKQVAAMLRKHNLSIKSSKTKISDRKELHKDFEVTGLCVRSSSPKVRKRDRRYIRQLVYHCEKKSLTSRTSEQYHSLWNKTSGLVAKLVRLNHSEGKDYRERLTKILPLYDQYQESKVVKRSCSALKIPREHHHKLGVIRKYNKLLYHLGILSRTNKRRAHYFRTRLVKHYSSVPTVKEYWEM